MAWSSSPLASWPRNSIGGATTVSLGAQSSVGADTVFGFTEAQFDGGISVTDDKGNIFNVDANESSCNRIHSAKNATVGGSHTLYVNGGGYMGGAGFAFSGGELTGTLLDAATNYGSSYVNSIQPGSITPAQDGELFISSISSFNSYNLGGATIDSGFSTPYGGGGSLYAAYLIKSPAGAVNPLWDNTNSGGGSVLTTMAAYFAAAAVNPWKPRAIIF